MIKCRWTARLQRDRIFVAGRMVYVAEQANIQYLVCYNIDKEQPSLMADQNSNKESKLRLKTTVVMI